MKVTAHHYKGETKQERCTISKKLFDLEPGLIFKNGEDIISPEAAKRGGFEFGDIALPEKVSTRVQLGEFIVQDLKVSRRDKNYLELYSRWSEYLPMT